MSSSNFSKKSSALLDWYHEDLKTRDVVITKAKLKEPAKPADLSHLRPDKKTRGTDW